MARKPGRTKSFSETVQVFIDQRLSPAAMGAEFVRYAERQVDQYIAHGVASPTYVRAVNGVAGAADSAATVPGRIDYRFDLLGAATAWAITYAVQRSPFRSGQFRRSFMVAIDGRPKLAAAFVASDAAGAAEIILYNPEPYSRKLDVQVGEGHRPIRFSVAPGLFEDTVAAIKSRYGNSIKATRVYNISLPGAYILRRGRDRGSPVQSPAVVITAR